MESSICLRSYGFENVSCFGCWQRGFTGSAKQGKFLMRVLGRLRMNRCTIGVSLVRRQSGTIRSNDCIRLHRRARRQHPQDRRADNHRRQCDREANPKSLNLFRGHEKNLHVVLIVITSYVDDFPGKTMCSASFRDAINITKTSARFKFQSSR